MIIVVVTPEPVPGPQMYRDSIWRGETQTIFMRSHVSGLKSLLPDILILAAGLSEEQEAIVRDKAKINNARIFREVPTVELELEEELAAWNRLSDEVSNNGDWV